MTKAATTSHTRVRAARHRTVTGAARLALTFAAIAAWGGYASGLHAQALRTISDQAQAALTAPPQMPAAGATRADVTIVEFLDYNCPFCKKTAPELQKLLASDRSVRILYKEWPIFGPVSQYAARAALAANWQGKFLAAHAALIGAPGDLDETSQVDSTLRGAGIDLKRLADDRKRHAEEIDAILTRNTRETAELGLRGTPVFVVGRQLVPRSLTLLQLQQLVASARRNE